MAKWGDFYEHRTKDSWLDFLELAPVWGWFVEHVTSLPGERLLEVGCGPGSLSIFFSLLGYDVVGVDNDESILETARSRNKRFRGKAVFRSADAFKLPFEDDRFDCIFNLGFFEHFSDEDIRTIVRECLRVAPNLVFGVPGVNYPRQDLGNERLLPKQKWEDILSPFHLSESFEDSKEAAWHSKSRRLFEMFCSFILHKDIRKPTRYVACVRRSAYTG